MRFLKKAAGTAGDIIAGASIIGMIAIGILMTLAVQQEDFRIGGGDG